MTKYSRQKGFQLYNEKLREVYIHITYSCIEKHIFVNPFSSRISSSDTFPLFNTARAPVIFTCQRLSECISCFSSAVRECASHFYIREQYNHVVCLSLWQGSVSEGRKAYVEICFWWLPIVYSAPNYNKLCTNSAVTVMITVVWGKPLNSFSAFGLPSNM